MNCRGISILQWLTGQTCTGFTVLVIALSALTGCATDGRVPAAHESSEGKGPSVARFEDGREGFIITEDPEMDESSRRDFDHAAALMNDNEYARAIDLLRGVIEKSPGVTAPYINMAIAYRGAGRPEEAEQQLKAALELFPGHPAASNEYGLLYRETGRFAEARDIYEKTIARFPEFYPAHRNLGILCDLYLDDPACALRHYEIYSEAMPAKKEVKMWIADLRTRFKSSEEER